MKGKVLALFLTLVFVLSLSACSGVSKEEYDKLAEELESVKTEYENYKTETADFAKLSEAQRAEEVAKAEAAQLKAEQEAKELKEKQEAERIAAEQKAEEERKAEEAKGYETGITFKQLSRNPDDYKGKKVKFTGYVLQIMEGTSENQMRVATSGHYDDVIYVAYDPDDLDFRLLDDDNVVIYGVSIGLYSYETVLGDTVTLPAIVADRVELKK